MENLKVTHIGEDYATIELNGAEYEISRGLGEALRKEIRRLKDDREDVKNAFDFMLNVLEEIYPKYHGSDAIATVLDLYKRLFN